MDRDTFLLIHHGVDCCHRVANIKNLNADDEFVTLPARFNIISNFRTNNGILSLEEGSSVLASIHDIQKQVHPACVLKQKEGDPLFDYTVNLNNLRKIIYISAEVRPDSLHKGFYPTDEATTVALAQGRTGDCAGQYIGQQLGGGGHPTNVFPLNQMLDTGSWKADEDKVYAHVKQGESARLKYGIEYEKICSDERSRPTKIYYHFQLLGNDQVVSETIEGVFENTSPRITNPWKKQFA